MRQNKTKKTTQKKLVVKKTTKKVTSKPAKKQEQSPTPVQQPVFNSFAEEYRFYCKNENLLKEMYKWRNSCDPNYNKTLFVEDGKIMFEFNGKNYVIPQPLKVMKLVGRKLVPTETYDEKDDDFEYKIQNHEPYKEGTRYFIEFPKTHERFLMKRPKSFRYYRENDKTVIEEVTELVQNDGFTFDIDDPKSRQFSNEFGNMVSLIAKKVSNHSFFRNYRQDTKEDCQVYAIEKIFRGIINYKLKFQNVFAYITTACFNSFKTELSKYYKQMNIRRDLTKKAMARLQSEMPGSSMEKCLGNQFTGNDYDSFQEF